MTPLRVLVVDDEAMARRRLLRLLEAMPDVRVVGECSRAAEALARAADADVLLLDIHMPGVTGLEALGLIPGRAPIVIFCTAHAQHAVAAFEGGARDYLLKPVEPARLRLALDRAREALRPAVALPTRLPLETRGGVALVDPADIRSLELDDALVAVTTADATYLSTRPLAEFEATLGPHGFFRVHRKALVNLARVVRLEDDGAGGTLARLDTGRTVEVSRASGRELRRLLGI